MKSSETLGRRPGGWIERAAPPRRRSRAAALLLVCAVLLGASPSRGEEPFRLRLAREPADVAAAAEGAACVRGRVYLVREFGSGPAARGIWIADALETSGAVPAGIYAGVARDDAETGWRIELPELGSALRAHPGASAEAAAADDILLGKRAASPTPAGACDLAREQVSDATAIVRRLRDAYASPTDERPIQVSIEP